MQTNCILEGEGQCASKLYRIASCGRSQNSTDTKQGSGQTTSARGMVGVVDVTTVQEYTGATHRLHTADLAPVVSTACCFHSPVSSLVYLLFCVHFVLGFHRIGWCWGQGSTCWYYSGPSEVSRQRIDWVIVRKIFNSQWLLFKVRWRHWKRVVNCWNSSRIPNLFGTSRELSVWERSGCPP